MSSLPDNWRVFDSAEEVADYASRKILELAHDAISERGAFHFVAAGGTTPISIYRILAKREIDTAADWEKWHIYLGDERCLPVGDPQRNSVALHEAWLANSRIPQSHIHMIPAELGPAAAAESYEKTIKDIQFDCTLLGMGEDGHTASLFPGRPPVQNRLVQTELNSPKPPSERVSLSMKCLNRSLNLFKLVTGSGKQDAVTKWLRNEALPIAQVQGVHTEVLISQDSLPDLPAKS